MAYVIPFIPYIVGAAAAVYGGVQQRKAGEAAASMDEANAKITRQQSNAAEEAQRREGRLVMGQVRASAAESGFSPGGGSLLNLQTQTAGELELDALTTRYRGQLQSIGLEADAAMTRTNAKTAETSGYLNAFGTLMSGASGYLKSSKIDQYPINNSATGAAIRGRR